MFRTRVVFAILVGMLGMALAMPSHAVPAKGAGPQISDGPGDTLWTERYNGPGSGADYAKAFAVDAAGNSYVAGSSLGSGTGYDMIVIKYDAAGVQQWAARYDSLVDDEALGIAVDGSGNVYVTGFSGNYPEYCFSTVKYNSGGARQWANHYGGATGDDDARGNAVVIDALGNVCVTGYSRATGGYADYITISYGPGGGQRWLTRYTSHTAGDRIARAIGADAAGNVYVTGSAIDTSGYENYLTIKYDSLGGQAWAQPYNGAGNAGDIPAAIAVDAAGDVFVTGNSPTGRPPAGVNNYLTVKYNSAGAQQWTGRYGGTGGAGGIPTALCRDQDGNVIVTGGAGNGGGHNSFATVEYTAAGAQSWVKQYDSPSGNEAGATAVTVDTAGNVYVTGSAFGQSNSDYATVLYDPDGTQLSVASYNSPFNGDDVAAGIGLDAAANVYVTGSSFKSGADYDILTIKYQAGAGGVAEAPVRNLSSALSVVPNPSRGATAVGYSMPLAGRASLKLYNASGRLVRTLSQGWVKAGLHRAQLDAGTLAGGVYLLKLTGPGLVASARLVIE